jgi:hypothetical protein
VLNRHESWTVEHLISETKTKLLTVKAENRTIAAAFGLSYQYLPARQQEFFRRLGLHPGTTIDANAAAALAGVSLRDAAGYLDAFHGEGLLSETGHRRYGMHDLIRRYARDLVAEDSDHERRDALGGSRTPASAASITPSTSRTVETPWLRSDSWTLG